MFFSGYYRARLLLLAGVVAAAAIFTFASRQFHVPAFPGFGGSLMAEPSPLVATLVVAAALLVSVLLATLIAGTVRFDAGLFCAALGMTALSIRGGHIGDVLRQAGPSGSPVIFVHLALELVVLYALVALAWSVLWALHTGGHLKADEFRDGIEDTDEPLIFNISALAMQAGVMILGMMLLAQSDAKAQALAAVGISSFIGACAAYYMYPISASAWLWVGPMIVGIAGYIFAYLTLGHGDLLWKTGQLNFALAPLARPLPLDYATAGPAGAILGYWLSRRWHRQRLTESAAPESSPTPAP